MAEEVFETTILIDMDDVGITVDPHDKRHPLLLELSGVGHELRLGRNEAASLAAQLQEALAELDAAVTKP